MAYGWYKIFNTDEFDELDLVSKTYSLELQAVGGVEVLVTKGADYGITYEGIFLPLNLNAKNPYYFEGHAIFKTETNDVYLGITDGL